jgi:hypothetical protein
VGQRNQQAQKLRFLRERFLAAELTRKALPRRGSRLKVVREVGLVVLVVRREVVVLVREEAEVLVVYRLCLRDVLDVAM